MLVLRKIFLPLILFRVICINIPAYLKVGRDEAAVKMLLAGSYTCKQCAEFYTKLLPELISKYVNTLKLQVIFIDKPQNVLCFYLCKLVYFVEQQFSPQLAYQLKLKLMQEQVKWIKLPYTDLKAYSLELVNNLVPSSLLTKQLSDDLTNLDDDAKLRQHFIDTNQAEKEKFNCDYLPCFILEGKVYENMNLTMLPEIIANEVLSKTALAKGVI